MEERIYINCHARHDKTVQCLVDSKVYACVNPVLSMTSQMSTSTFSLSGSRPAPVEIEEEETHCHYS
jgi:hypothetical protein